MSEESLPDRDLLLHLIQLSRQIINKMTHNQNEDHTDSDQIHLLESDSTPFIPDVDQLVAKAFLRTSLRFACRYLTSTDNSLIRIILLLIYTVLEVEPGFYPVCLFQSYFCSLHFSYSLKPQHSRRISINWAPSILFMFFLHSAILRIMLIPCQSFVFRTLYSFTVSIRSFSNPHSSEPLHPSIQIFHSQASQFSASSSAFLLRNILPMFTFFSLIPFDNTSLLLVIDFHKLRLS